jgi:tetratricopeptide (TPR) repeat protein
MKMYKKILITGQACLLLMFAGCESFIDIPVEGVLSSESAYRSESDAIAVVTGCYDAIHGNNWNICFPIMFGDWCSDDSWKGGENASDQGESLEVMYFYAGTNNKFVEYIWRVRWMGIYRCNNALQVIPAIDMNVALKERLLAEVKFLRAYQYFELVKHFGDLPKVTIPVTPAEAKLPREDKSVIYAEIIEKDLTEAAGVLPQKDAYSPDNAGRATRGAALAFLGKAYLYQGKYQQAFDLFKTVINEGKYALEADFLSNWDVDNENNIESVFELQEDGSQIYSEGSGLPTLMRSRADGGWGYNLPSTSLLNAFEPGDPRRKLTIIEEGDIIEGASYSMNNVLPPKRTSHKHYIPKAKRVSNEWEHSNYNLRIFRYADLLLMYAEAAVGIQDASTARWALEQVRARARNLSEDPSALPEVTTTDLTELTKAIQHERRVELALEQTRFWDICRWGIAKQVLTEFYEFNMNANAASDRGDDKGRLFQEGKHELFAIPAKDCEVAGWTNNPGY